MGKFRMAYTITAIVIGGIMVMCNSKNAPTSPTGTIIFSEGFESNLTLDSLGYKQVVYTDGEALMSISTQCAHTGTHSLTSDSNNTSIKYRIEPPISDSIAGLQFYLMATKAAHTNFLTAICQPGSSANGLFIILGLGIDKSDSLMYFCQTDPDSASITSKKFAALTLNKWYKCKIEYNYTDTTLTYYVDDIIVGQTITSSPTSLQTFVAMRDNLGAQGTSGYYLDDISIYKR